MQELIAKFRVSFANWLGCWSEGNDHENQSTVSFLIRIGSILLLYIVLDRILIRITYLSLDNYYSSSIYLSFIKKVFTSWYIFPIFALGLLVILFRKKLFVTWDSLARGQSVRILVTVAAGLLTWVYGTYGYNFYFDQGHYFDRLLLFVFLLLIYFRPVFVLPFLSILLPITWQFFVLPSYSLTAAFPLIRILILFQCFVFVYLITKKFVIADFVFLAGCLMAAHYWTSGFEKLSLNWILYDQVIYMLPSRYANGWLVFLDASTISSITGFMGNFNFPIKIFTLLVEFGAFLFFLHRRIPPLLIVGWILFHLGVLLTSGFFFWQWILIEITLLWLFTRKNGFLNLPIFTKKHIVVSMILVISGAYWCRPGTLAWFDLPVTYTYRFEAENLDGEKYPLPPNFFAPYDYQFSLSVFRYLNPERMVPFTWGTSKSSEVALKVMNIKSPEGIFEYEKSEGIIYFNFNQKEEFDKFIKQFVGNWNKRHSNESYLSYVQAPRLLLTYPTKIDATSAKPIKHIQIVQVTSFFHDGVYREIRRLPLHKIMID